MRWSRRTTALAARGRRTTSAPAALASSCTSTAALRMWRAWGSATLQPWRPRPQQKQLCQPTWCRLLAAPPRCPCLRRLPQPRAFHALPRLRCCPPAPPARSGLRWRSSASLCGVPKAAPPVWPPSPRHPPSRSAWAAIQRRTWAHRLPWPAPRRRPAPPPRLQPCQQQQQQHPCRRPLWRPPPAPPAVGRRGRPHVAWRRRPAPCPRCPPAAAGHPWRASVRRWTCPPPPSVWCAPTRWTPCPCSPAPPPRWQVRSVGCSWCWLVLACEDGWYSQCSLWRSC